MSFLGVTVGVIEEDFPIFWNAFLQENRKKSRYTVTLIYPYRVPYKTKKIPKFGDFFLSFFYSGCNVDVIAFNFSSLPTCV